MIKNEVLPPYKAAKPRFYYRLFLSILLKYYHENTKNNRTTQG